MQRILDGLYVLEAARSVNAFLIDGSQGLTLVDTGPARGAEALFDEIAAGGFRIEDIQRIVLTHAHPDHAGGAAPFLRRHRVKVFAHPQEGKALDGSGAAPRGIGLRGRLAAFLSVFSHGRPEPIDVLVPASPREPIRALPQWQVLHCPGHTPGSLSLYDPARGILLCGDALSNRGGKLEIGAEAVTADPAAAIETARRLAGLDFETLCFGHGPVIRQRACLQLEQVLKDLPR